jgi:putative ABC transport system ATP-binding protein
MTLFELDGLCKFYRASSRADVRALDNLILGIERGTFLVVTGRSGSGKSTLLSMLGALERPSAGRIVFDGKELTRCSGMELARVRRRMGFVFQDFSLIPSLTVLENITYPLIPRGLSRVERSERALSLLSRFDLSAKLTARASELSGGEQQRVAIARAMAGRPEVILADEPTSNLDGETTQFVLSTLREAHREGTTIILASHDQDVIAMARRVLHLERGRLL